MVTNGIPLSKIQHAAFDARYGHPATRNGFASDYASPARGRRPSGAACDGKRCRITVRGLDGYVRQDRLWGVSPVKRCRRGR
jgi:hypothetical protein